MRLWTLLLVGCVEQTAETAPTWEQDVAPIVAEHCGSCHTEGGVAFSLDYYDLAAPMASAMSAAVQSGAMPPWAAQETDACAPRLGWKDDLRLSDAEKATITAWAEADAPRGDTAAAAALPDAPDLSLPDATQEVSPRAAYTTAGTDDEFVCFVLDPELSEDAWLTGLQVVAGNSEVVHHVLVFSDPDRKSESLADDEGKYDCFGSSNVSNASLIGAWAPGSVPNETPEGTGMTITAGSLLVMQIHYHPAGRDAAPDLTSLQLRWADTEPERHAVLALVGNASSKREGLEEGPNDEERARFFIPAGVADHTEAMHFDVPEGDGPYTVYSVGTHMHYIGTDMVIRVQHAAPEGDEPSDECLIQTPTWDFNWQRGYAYDAPLDQVPQIRGGDTIWMQCTYNNTLDNPGVQQALADAGLDAPVDVELGEETLDEMCLGVFGIVYD